MSPYEATFGFKMNHMGSNTQLFQKNFFSTINIEDDLKELGVLDD